MYEALPAMFDRLPLARAVSTDNPDQLRALQGEKHHGGSSLNVCKVTLLCTFLTSSGKAAGSCATVELQPETGLLQTQPVEVTEEGMTGKDVPVGGFLRHNSDVLGQQWSALLRSKWVCCCGCQWVQHGVLEMVWGQNKAQTLDLQGRRTPALRVTRSRAVSLLGINPAVCQTLHHGIS